MKPGLWEILNERANGACECCGEPLGFGFARASVDHFFGRGKSAESESTCWVLRFDHHEAKTQSRPDAAHWLKAFCVFAARHNYRASFERALKQLAWKSQRSSFEEKRREG